MRGGGMAQGAERPYLDELSLGQFLRERLDPETASVGRAPARQRKLAAGFNCCVPSRQ